MWKKIRKELARVLVGKEEAARNQRSIASLKYGPLLAVIFAAGSFGLASVGTSFLLSIYPLMQGWDQAQTNNWFNTSIVAQFFVFLLSSMLMVVAAYGFLRIRRQPLKMVGVTWPRWRDAFRGLLAYTPYLLVLMATVSFVRAFIPSIDVNQQQELFTAPVTGGGVILVFLALVIIPPIAEEFVLRGVLYTGIRKRFSFIWSAIMVSAIFGSLHLPASSDGPLWIAAIDTALLSFFLCYLREKTGNIWAGVTLHFVKNFIAFITLFVIT